MGQEIENGQYSSLVQERGPPGWTSACRLPSCPRSPCEKPLQQVIKGPLPMEE